MKIGIDFDNTIVNYNTLFYKVAIEQNLIPPETPATKAAVREHIVRIGQEDRWTLMQGLVYGDRMDEALMYEGVKRFFDWAGKSGHQLAIISHKTKYPYMGPKFDLHHSAKLWVTHHLKRNNNPLIDESMVFFELTKKNKLLRIKNFGCDVFIDDLPEILFDDIFPSETNRVLFNPDRKSKMNKLDNLSVCENWADIIELLRI